MGDINHLKNITLLTDDINPFAFACLTCGKTREFSEKDIDALKKPYKDPQNHDYDYYIPCIFCKKGRMEPQNIVFSDNLDDE